MKVIILAAMTAVLSTLSMSARAIPITWDFVGAGASGGTITGTYVYDADTDIFSAISVATSGGTLPSLTYTFDSNPAWASSTILDFYDAAAAGADFTGLNNLFIQLNSAMTNSGGTISFFAVNFGVCADPTCNVLNPDNRDEMPNGNVVARTTQVPEPTTLILLGLGLAGMGFTRRRRKTTSV